MPARRLCALALLVVATGCSHSAATGGTSAATTQPRTIVNQILAATTSPRVVRHVHLGMSRARVEAVAAPQRLILARGFSHCWIYQGSKSVAVVCFRHGVVAFKAGPGTPSTVGRALKRASR